MGVDNGIEDMPALTAQSNIDGKFYSYTNYTENSKTQRFDLSDVSSDNKSTIDGNPEKMYQLLDSDKLLKYYDTDYTVYMQPTVYTVKAGHKLVLVLFPSSYDNVDALPYGGYVITVDNTKSYLELPCNK